ncbi:uncharacterized protein LOC135829591 [Sycon ciliatum]|uniref:uncharacterized protein LOC135829591 n=1 Tax=Sycon ciliatum TaxID=27933 RepID=UPI0031F66013
MSRPSNVGFQCWKIRALLLRVFLLVCANHACNRPVSGFVLADSVKAIHVSVSPNTTRLSVLGDAASVAGIPTSVSLVVRLVYSNGSSSEDVSSHNDTTFSVSDNRILQVLKRQRGSASDVVVESKILTAGLSVVTVRHTLLSVHSNITFSVVEATSLSLRITPYPEYPGSTNVDASNLNVIGHTNKQQQGRLWTTMSLSDNTTLDISQSSNLQYTLTSTPTSLAKIQKLSAFHILNTHKLSIDYANISVTLKGSADVPHSPLTVEFANNTLSVCAIFDHSVVSSSYSPHVVYHMPGINAITLHGLPTQAAASFDGGMILSDGTVHYAVKKGITLRNTVNVTSENENIAYIRSLNGYTLLRANHHSAVRVSFSSSLNGITAVPRHTYIYANLDPQPGDVDIGSRYGAPLPAVENGTNFSFPMTVNAFGHVLGMVDLTLHYDESMTLVLATDPVEPLKTDTSTPGEVRINGTFSSHGRVGSRVQLSSFTFMAVSSGVAKFSVFITKLDKNLGDSVGSLNGRTSVASDVSMVIGQKPVLAPLPANNAQGFISSSSSKFVMDNISTLVIPEDTKTPFVLMEFNTTQPWCYSKFLKFSIFSGNSIPPTFNIHPATGQLSVIRNFDHRHINFFNITINVLDTLTPKLVNQVQLKNITVLKANTPPKFPPGNLYNLTVSKYAMAPLKLLELNATDDDDMASPNGFLSHRIVSGNESGKFVINVTSGTLSLVRSLISESDNTVYLLVIEVRDHGLFPNSVNATVTIRVVDVQMLLSTMSGVKRLSIQKGSAASAGVVSDVALTANLVFADGRIVDCTVQTSTRFSLNPLSNVLSIARSPTTLVLRSQDIVGNSTVRVYNSQYFLENSTLFSVVEATSLSLRITPYPEYPGSTNVDASNLDVIGHTGGEQQQGRLWTTMSLSDNTSLDISQSSNLQYTLTSTPTSLARTQKPSKKDFYILNRNPSCSSTSRCGIGSVNISVTLNSSKSEVPHSPLTVQFANDTLSVCSIFNHTIEPTLSSLHTTSQMPWVNAVSLRGLNNMTAAIADCSVILSDGTIIYDTKQIGNLTAAVNITSENENIVFINNLNGYTLLRRNHHSAVRVSFSSSLNGITAVSQHSYIYANLDPERGDVDIGSQNGVPLPAVQNATNFSFPLYVNCPNLTLGMVDLTLHYDKSMTLILDTKPVQSLQTDTASTPGEIRIHGTLSSNVTRKGNRILLCTLTFKAVSPGIAKFNVFITRLLSLKLKQPISSLEGTNSIASDVSMVIGPKPISTPLPLNSATGFISDSSSKFVIGTIPSLVIPEDIKTPFVLMEFKVTQPKCYSQFLNFSISSGNSIPPTFDIHPSTGQLSIIRNLDYRRTNLYNLTIDYYDTFISKLDSQVRLESITVLKANIPPQFPHGNLYNLTVSKYTMAPLVLLELNATDDDDMASPDGFLSYKIVSGDENGKFVISATSGALSVVKSLISESDNTVYLLVVEVRDHGLFPNSVNATVTIRVVDVHMILSTLSGVKRLSIQKGSAASAGMVSVVALTANLVFADGRIVDCTVQTSTRFSLSPLSNVLSIVRSPTTLVVKSQDVVGNSTIRVNSAKYFLENSTLFSVVKATSLSLRITPYPEYPGSTNVDASNLDIIGNTGGEQQQGRLWTTMSLSDNTTLDISQSSNLQYTLTSTLTSLARTRKPSKKDFYILNRNPSCSSTSRCGIGSLNISVTLKSSKSEVPHSPLTVQFANDTLSVCSIFNHTIEPTLSSLHTASQMPGVNAVALRGLNNMTAAIADCSVILSDGTIIYDTKQIGNLTAAVNITSENENIVFINNLNGYTLLRRNHHSAVRVSFSSSLNGITAVSQHSYIYANLDPERGDVDIGSQNGVPLPAVQNATNFSFPLYVNCPNLTLGMVDLTLHYDKSMTLILDTKPVQSLQTDTASTPGEIRIHGTLSSNVTRKGNRILLCTLTFKAVSPGIAKFNVFITRLLSLKLKQPISSLEGTNSIASDVSMVIGPKPISTPLPLNSATGFISDSSSKFVIGTIPSLVIPEDIKTPFVLMEFKVTQPKCYSQFLNFSISSGNSIPPTFDIHPSTGQLSIIRNLDYRRTNLYNLTIDYYDTFISKLASQVRLENITVLKANVPPQFPNGNLYNLTVSKYAMAPLVLLELNATDDDDMASPDGFLSYKIVSGDENGKFVTSATSGALSVVKSLISESDNTVYLLVVEVKDHGLFPNSVNATVTIRVVDVHMILSTLCGVKRLSIQKGSAASAGMVSDVALTANLVFADGRIVDCTVQTSTRFSLSPLSNVLSIVRSPTTLVVRSMDVVGNATVRVYSAKYFLENSILFSVVEATSLSMRITPYPEYPGSTNVDASNLDIIGNTGGEQQQGRLWTTMSFTDHTVSDMSMNGNLKLILTNNSHLASLGRHLSSGYYIITPSGTGIGNVLISAALSGKVSVQTPLSVNISKDELAVCALFGMTVRTGGLSANALVRVDGSTADYILRNTTAHSHAIAHADVHIILEDGTVYYDVLNSAGLKNVINLTSSAPTSISINRSTGHVTLLSSQHYPNPVVLHASAKFGDITAPPATINLYPYIGPFHNSSALRSLMSRLLIHSQAEMSQILHGRTPNISINVSEDAAQQSRLFQLNQSNFYTCNVPDIFQYQIIAGNPGSHFSIDQNTGVLSLAKLLDRETASELKLLVAPKYRGALLMQSAIAVQIAVTDVNDQSPACVHKQTKAFVAGVNSTGNAASLPGTALTVLLAEDQDVVDEGKLTYSITAGDPNKQFSIDNRGALHTASSHNLSGAHVTQPQHLVVQVTDTADHYTLCLVDLVYYYSSHLVLVPISHNGSSSATFNATAFEIQLSAALSSALHKAVSVHVHRTVSDTRTSPPLRRAVIYAIDSAMSTGYSTVFFQGSLIATALKNISSDKSHHHLATGLFLTPDAIGTFKPELSTSDVGMHGESTPPVSDLQVGLISVISVLCATMMVMVVYIRTLRTSKSKKRRVLGKTHSTLSSSSPPTEYTMSIASSVHTTVCEQDSPLKMNPSRRASFGIDEDVLMDSKETGADNAKPGYENRAALQSDSTAMTTSATLNYMNGRSQCTTLYDQNIYAENVEQTNRASAGADQIYTLPEYALAAVAQGKDSISHPAADHYQLEPNWGAGVHEYEASVSSNPLKQCTRSPSLNLYEADESTLQDCPVDSNDAHPSYLASLSIVSTAAATGQPGSAENDDTYGNDTYGAAEINDTYGSATINDTYGSAEINDTYGNDAYGDLEPRADYLYGNNDEADDDVCNNYM